jgi:hypothetical protein
MPTALHIQTPEDFFPDAEYSSSWLDGTFAPAKSG